MGVEKKYEGLKFGAEGSALEHVVCVHIIVPRACTRDETEICGPSRTHYSRLVIWQGPYTLCERLNITWPFS